MPGFGDPIVWMDAFYAAFNVEGRDPVIDALAFHWYDYGLDEQLSRLEVYGKPFWVTEMANWHTEPGWTIDTPEKQINEMVSMVEVRERRRTSSATPGSWGAGTPTLTTRASLDPALANSPRSVKPTWFSLGDGLRRPPSSWIRIDI